MPLNQWSGAEPWPLGCLQTHRRSLCKTSSYFEKPHFLSCCCSVFLGHLLALHLAIRLSLWMFCGSGTDKSQNGSDCACPESWGWAVLKAKSYFGSPQAATPGSAVLAHRPRHTAPFFPGNAHLAHWLLRRSLGHIRVHPDAAPVGKFLFEQLLLGEAQL